MRTTPSTTLLASLIPAAGRILPRRLPVGRWIQVARERRVLAALDANRLRDLGIDPAEAAREAARPFWDLPEGR